ncbi:MAG: hypothetical protein GY814_13190 [Gammaproteobacteria bacterium]|nr:hypothetical protein [Gammaproteobacteria bacterium]
MTAGPSHHHPQLDTAVKPRYDTIKSSDGTHYRWRDGSRH